MSDPGEVKVEPARRSLWDRVSIVWLVPLAALAIAVGVAWNNWADRGPLITVYFDDAAGVETRETELRYRDVGVGVVEDVGFTDDLDRVAVHIRLEKQVAPYVDEAAQFWIVEPEVTTQGVTGLDTVLSGVYIEGLWDTRPGQPTYEFDGLASAPLLAGGQEGLQIILRTSGDSLTGRVPLVYRGVEVGQVGEAVVSLDGFTVEAPAVIYAPYDALVTEETRFWDTSGFSFSVGSGGAAVDFESLASLIVGGLTFDTFVSGAPLAEDGAVFDVYDDESLARSSVFNRATGPELTLMAVFDGNVSGLNVGAAVELDGLRIGEVSAINGIVERDDQGAEQVRLQAVLDIRPGRIGFEGQGAPEAALNYLIDEVESGLRARLATGNILTGGLKVQLVSLPDPGPGAVDLEADPYPRIPTVASDIADVAASAQDTLDRISALPIEEILGSVQSVLDSTAVLLASQDTQALPEEIRGILSDVRQITSSDELQAVPGQVGDVLTELAGAAGEINALVTALEEQDVPGRLLGAIDAVEATLASVDTALAGAPALIDEVTQLAATAGDLPLDELVTQVTGVAASADALLGSEAAAALPGRIGSLTAELEATVAEARALVAGLNEQGGPDRLLAAVDAAGAAATSLDEALAGVPQVVERLDAVAAQVQAMELQAVSERLAGVLASADAVISSEDVQAIPARVTAIATELEGAVAEANALVSGLNEGGGAERVLAAVDQAGAAAASLDTALQGVPGLIERLDAVAAQVGASDIDGVVARLESVLASANGILATESAQALPGQVNALAAELQATVAEARALISGITADDGGARLLAAVDSAAAAAASLDAALAGVPQVVERIDAVAANLQAADLAGAVARLDTLLASADALVSSETTAALPADLSALADELSAGISETRALIADFSGQGGTGRLLAAIDSAGEAAGAVEEAVAGVPQVVSRIDGVVAGAETVDLQGIGDSLEQLLASADALLSGQDTQELPGNLGDALTELRLILAQLREGGAVENANATLASIRVAADQLATSLDTLPGLITQANTVLGTTGATVEAYGENGALARDLRAALREVSQAAENIARLARTLERQPNSLILGR
ncbi:MlaD family protein [Wenxinia marina]|uniref:Paraquat-inducible protein B n=1 Tax=Wenxinia marina DSM 24838 TaxID=1123501 RepID=A0A0D0Q925_9RHOB|nr:MlaD family protein [Wenxinia marina]KIQ68877.1 Paraquat-inducible protein B [Wenxinia marina DSM 24838]GGL64480.1 hypothetical protein GCM10011392_18950 [Wenxinia marina]